MFVKNEGRFVEGVECTITQSSSLLLINIIVPIKLKYLSENDGAYSYG